MLIFAVAYHVLPRFTGRPLYSERLTLWHFYLANVSLPLVIIAVPLSWTHPSGRVLAVAAAGGLAASFLVFVFNMTKTLFSKNASTDFLRCPMDNDDCVVLDVRPILASGRDPFTDIMAAVGGLPAGKRLKILNSFEPVPLPRARRQGLRPRDDARRGNIRDRVLQKGRGRDGPRPIRSLGPARRGGGVVEIDVRGLEPPEPMVKILETLNTLPPGARLVVHHHRDPALLYDKLDARGYRAKTEKIDEGHYLVTIVPK